VTAFLKSTVKWPILSYHYYYYYLFIVCEPRVRTTMFEEQNWVEPWLIRPSPSFRGIKISKFITDPYDLASLLFILAIFVSKAT